MVVFDARYLITLIIHQCFATREANDLSLHVLWVSIKRACPDMMFGCRMNNGFSLRGIDRFVRRWAKAYVSNLETLKVEHIEWNMDNVLVWDYQIN